MADPPVEVIVVACVVPVVVVGCCILLLLTRKFQSLLAYVHWYNWPPYDHTDLARPSPAWARRLAALLGPTYEGLPEASPFSATGPKGIVRGLRVPRTAPGHRVVLYLHGTTGNVAVRHRVELYKLLAAPPFCCDVVAIDYAGFGRSDGFWPDEDTVVRDALAALEALPDRRSNVIIWGHSMGTGIAIGAMARLLCGAGAEQPLRPASDQTPRRGQTRDLCAPLTTSKLEGGASTVAAASELPLGVILEAPFLSVPDAAVGYLSRCRLPSRPLRNLLNLVVRAHRMPSQDRIAGVARRLPLTVLHGVRDSVIPFDQGRQLAALAGAPLHSFDRGHDDIVQDPKLVEVLKSVIREWEGLGGKAPHGASLGAEDGSLAG